MQSLRMLIAAFVSLSAPVWAQPVPAHLYECHGDTVTISYAATGRTGVPTLTIHCALSQGDSTALRDTPVPTVFVGEKIIIQVPTWFFPADTGPDEEDSRGPTHEDPNSHGTVRFAEPVMIDTHQNFRVEIEVPDSEALREPQRRDGPQFIWIILDGYMSRDVR